MAAGPGVPGLAFRSDGPTLEAVRVRLAPPRPRPVGEEGAEQQQQQQQQQQEFLPAGAAAEGLASVPLSAGAGAAAGLRAVHLAASADGRMVCAACSDGSLRCYDAVLAGGGDADADAVRLSPRWAVPGAHSHDDRRGGSNGGGVRSLAFAPSPGGAAGGAAGGAGHLVLLVDAAEGSLAIYDAAAEAMMAAEEAAGAGPGTLAVARWGADCGGSGGGGGGGGEDHLGVLVAPTQRETLGGVRARACRREAGGRRRPLRPQVDGGRGRQVVLARQADRPRRPVGGGGGGGPQRGQG